MQIKIELLIVGLIFLMGCRTLPKYMDECDISAEWIGEVQECKDKVIAREDRIASDKIQEEREEALSKQCWQVQRGIWDKRLGRCRDWNML